MHLASKEHGASGTAALVAAPQLPVVLYRPDHLARRHVDGHRGRGVAGVPPLALSFITRPGGVREPDTGVPAGARRRTGCGPPRPAKDPDMDADAQRDPGDDPGGPDADAPRDHLARDRTGGGA